MVEYSKLSKPQKVAAFLIMLGPESAAEVMKHFDDPQLEIVCREMSVLPMIDRETQKALLLEFAGVVHRNVGALPGGAVFAHDALSRARGADEATQLLHRISPTPTQAAPGLRHVDTDDLSTLAKTEQPQTIAFLLSFMEPPAAARLLETLPQELREDVIEKLAGLEATPHDAATKVARNLSGSREKPLLRESNGLSITASVLKALDKDTRKHLLASIDGRDAALGAAIRQKAFSFDDLTRLAAPEMQRIMREVDGSDLPIVVKVANADLARALLAGLSKRAAESVREELDMMGAPKPKDVAAAQERIMQVVRRLEEAEEISLDGGEESAAA